MTCDACDRWLSICERIVQHAEHSGGNLASFAGLAVMGLSAPQGAEHAVQPYGWADENVPSTCQTRTKAMKAIVCGFVRAFLAHRACRPTPPAEEASAKSPLNPQKQTFGDTPSNVRYWGLSGHWQVPDPES